MRNKDTKIKATLKYGRYISDARIGLLYFAAFFPLTLLIFTVVIIFFIAFEFFYLESDNIITLIGANVFLISISSISFFYILRYKKINEEVSKWLEDAVSIKADIYRLDSSFTDYKPYQIKVVFFIDGKKTERLSEKGNAIIGYNKWLLRFAGENREILYSPKYDQVILL